LVEKLPVEGKVHGNGISGRGYPGVGWTSKSSGGDPDENIQRKKEKKKKRVFPGWKKLKYPEELNACSFSS